MKKIMSGLLVSATVLGLGITAQAAEGDVTTIDGIKDVNSKATITVKQGGGTTDPEAPNEPDGKTDQEGPLSIDNVIVFAFQDMELSGSTQRIPLKATTAQNVQVTDKRGTGAGWNLQVQQSELTDETDPANIKTLKGAYIEFANPRIVAGEDNVGNDLAPVANTNTLFSNNTEFMRLMNAESEVVDGNGYGMGTWLEYFDNDAPGEDGIAENGIKLVVPASGNMVGDYKGTVTWRLSDGPEGTAPQTVTP